MRTEKAFEGAFSKYNLKSTMGVGNAITGNDNSRVPTASLTVASLTCWTLTSQQGSARKPCPSLDLQQALSGVRLVSENPDSEQVCAETAKPNDVKPMSTARINETKGFNQYKMKK